jgi:hypothetical protein
MKRNRTFFLAMAAALCATLPILAQSPIPNAGPPGWNAAMTKLFGEVKEFTAKADLRMLDKAGQETASVAGMGFALLDEKVRTEFDLTRMKSAQVPADAMAGLKQMGMDRTITFVESGKKTVSIVFPGLQAVVVMPVPDEAGSTDPKGLKQEATPVGNESLDGQACVKNKVVITDAQGQKREVLVWNATALRSFPLQLRFVEGDSTVVMRFKEVQLERPDARQFEIPAGYVRYGSFQDLMQNAMMKMIGGALGGKQ